jgi:quercetin dioxygenase-like cupin family protein
VKTGHYTDVAPEKAAMPGAQAWIRWIITARDGAPLFTMRVVELLDRGNVIPLHAHPYEHEIFVIEGRGHARYAGGEHAVGVGDFVYVEPGEEHGFENTGDVPFRFICVIPNPKQA